MSNTFRISLLTATVLFSASALSALPQGYPAEYQKVVDAATKEGKVVIYSTTDIKAAGPLIQGFEKMLWSTKTGHRVRVFPVSVF